MTPQPDSTKAHQSMLKALSLEVQIQREAWTVNKRRAKCLLDENDRNFARYWQSSLNNAANLHTIRLLEEIINNISMKSTMQGRKKNLVQRVIGHYKYLILEKRKDISLISSALHTSEAQKDSYLVEKSGLFDADWYLSKNDDVRQAGVDPLDHYMTFGWREGRDPCAIFETNNYLKDNVDVAAANVNPLVHFIRFGIVEGRGPIKKTLSFIRSGNM